MSVYASTPNLLTGLSNWIWSLHRIRQRFLCLTYLSFCLIIWHKWNQYSNRKMWKLALMILFQMNFSLAWRPLQRLFVNQSISLRNSAVTFSTNAASILHIYRDSKHFLCICSVNYAIAKMNVFLLKNLPINLPVFFVNKLWRRCIANHLNIIYKMPTHHYLFSWNCVWAIHFGNGVLQNFWIFLYKNGPIP